MHVLSCPVCARVRPSDHSCIQFRRNCRELAPSPPPPSRVHWPGLSVALLMLLCHDTHTGISVASSAFCLVRSPMLGEPSSVACFVLTNTFLCKPIAVCASCDGVHVSSHAFLPRSVSLPSTALFRLTLCGCAGALFLSCLSFPII